MLILLPDTSDSMPIINLMIDHFGEFIDFSAVISHQ